MLHGILYVLKRDCPWRSLPDGYGRWNRVYIRTRCWAERGVLATVFERLRDRGLVASGTEIAILDSTSVRHPGESACGWGVRSKKQSAKYRTLARRADN